MPVQPGTGLVLTSLLQGEHVNMITPLLQSKQQLKKTRIKLLLSGIIHTCRSIRDGEQQIQHSVASPSASQDLSDPDVRIHLEGSPATEVPPEVTLPLAEVVNHPVHRLWWQT